MPRSRFLQSLLAAAVLAAPLLADAGPDRPASGVADSGPAAGSFLPGAGGDQAFLYENGAATDRTTLIDPAPGWTVDGGAAIGDLQQIAGRACRAGVCQAVTFEMVSSVPEPPMIALVAAGLALGLARGKGGFRLPVRRRRG